MEVGFLLLSILALVAGIVLGMFIEKRRKPTKSRGIIYAYFDDSDSDPNLLLEPNVSMSDIASQESVLLDVIVIR